MIASSAVVGSETFSEKTMYTGVPQSSVLSPLLFYLYLLYLYIYIILIC